MSNSCGCGTKVIRINTTVNEETSGLKTIKIDCHEEVVAGSEGNDSQAEGIGQFAVGLSNELPDQSPTNVVLIRYLDGVGGNIVHTQVGGGPYPNLVSSQPNPPFGPIVVQSTFSSQEAAFEAAEMVFATASTTWAIAEFQQYTYAPGSFTLNGGASSFGGGADLIINAPGGSTEKFIVITCQDESQRAFLAVAPYTEQDITGGLPAGWTVCAEGGLNSAEVQALIDASAFVLDDAVANSTSPTGVTFNGTGAKVATFNGDIDVTGTIDPDGILFTDNGSYSSITSAALYFVGKGYDFAKVIWINPADGHAYRANVDLEAGGRDARFFDNTTGTLNMDNLVAALPLDDDGVVHLHAEQDVAVTNASGDAYTTIIDGVRATGVTGATNVPVGTPYIVSVDGAGVFTLTFATRSSSEWTQQDINTAGPLTISDGVSDKVWRAVVGVGSATWTVDSASYNPGARIIVSNLHLNTGDITLDPNMIGSGSGGPATQVLAPGENVTLVRQTSGAWMVTSRHPNTSSNMLMYFELGQIEQLLVDGPIADQHRYMVPASISDMEVIGLTMTLGTAPDADVFVEIAKNGVALGVLTLTSGQVSSDYAVLAGLENLVPGDIIQERVSVTDGGSASELTVGFHTLATLA